jgi:hypothetical protein
MQQSLNIFQLYCDLWKLDVNINKTKVMVFSKKKNLNYSFILQDKKLEVVEKFSYLGKIIQTIYAIHYKTVLLAFLKERHLKS